MGASHARAYHHSASFEIVGLVSRERRASADSRMNWEVIHSFRILKRLLPLQNRTWFVYPHTLTLTLEYANWLFWPVAMCF